VTDSSTLFLTVKHRTSKRSNDGTNQGSITVRLSICEPAQAGVIARSKLTKISNAVESQGLQLQDIPGPFKQRTPP